MKYLASYLLVLLLPIIIVSIYANSFFLKAYREEVIANNTDSIMRIAYALDVQLDQIEKTAAQLQFNEKFRPFFLESKQFNAMQTIDELSGHQVTNPFVHELVYYVRGSEELFSSDGSYTINTFIDYIYDFNSWDRDDFYAQINTILSPLMRPVEDVTTMGNEAKRFSALMYPIPNNSLSPYGTLIFIVPESSFRNIIKGAIPETKGNTIILDMHGKMITYLQNEPYLSDEVFGAILSGLSGSGSKAVKLDGKKYLISYTISERTRLKYFRIISEENAMASVVALRTTITLVFLLVLLVGGIAIYIAMRVNYSPVGELKRFIASRSDLFPKGTNEFDSAQLAILHLSETSSDLNRQVNRNSQILKEYLLQGLLRGMFKNSAEFNEHGKDIGLFFNHQFFQIAILSYTKQNNTSYPGDALIIDRLQKEASSVLESYWLSDRVEGRIILIACFPKANFVVFRDTLKALHKVFSDIVGAPSTFGVGNICGSVSQCYRSYIEASSALDYRHFSGDNKIIYFSDIIPKSSTSGIYPTQGLESLRQSILAGESRKIEEILHGLVNTIRENDTLLFFARCLSFDIINTVLRAVLEMHKNFPSPEDAYPDVFSLTEYHTVDELADIVEETCLSICGVIKNTEDLMKNDIADMLSYIEKNLNSFDFSIGGIADHYGMSVSNLSHLFKNRTGSTLSDYINTLRMEKIKELLLTSDDSIKDIIIQVGYSDSSNFVRKFREQIGMTPGAYRKLYGRKKSGGSPS